VNYNDPDIGFVLFGTRQHERGYIVTYKGEYLGVIVPCTVVRRYKTRGPKYYDGFEGFNTFGATHVSRTRRWLAERLRDSHIGRAVFPW
jgi:hypothetical protein